MRGLDSIVDPLPGKIGLYYKDLSTGKLSLHNEKEVFVAASVIKLPILVAVFQEIEEGNLKEDAILILTEADKVPSCGALNQMHCGLEVTIMDLCNLMITLSDNTATNMLIQVLGIEKINAILETFGMEKTRLNRLLFDAEAQKKGLENYICPREIGMLLEQIYTGQVISEAVSRKIEDILKAQKLNSKIPYLLPKHVPIAHKTGEDSGTTHDVGIIYSDHPFILCFLSNNTHVISAEAAIKAIALHCYNKSLAQGQ